MHVTNDSYGLYTVEIAERVRSSDYTKNNIIVSLSEEATLKDDSVEYIPVTTLSFGNYINKLQQLDNVVFHPYNLRSYEFLKILLKKFPGIKVYWICWSYEFYNLPHVVNKLYDPFSLKYIRSGTSLPGQLRQFLKSSIINVAGWVGIRKNYTQRLRHAYSLVDYFCSPFPCDFYYLNKIVPKNNITFEPFAYLSLNKIMPGLYNFRSKGNKIMIGHSSFPDGNHYEIIQKISSINDSYPVFLPLVYGDMVYGDLIKETARFYLKDLEILENRLDKPAYYQKLQEVGWAIINVKVQQGVGNIIGLVWMGAKVFLDKNSSIYIDFSKWGIFIFNIQDDLNKQELETKLTQEQVEKNRKIMLEKFGEETVSAYWKKILS